MGMIHHKTIEKDELRRYAGNFEHIVGISRMRYTEGKPKGAEVLDFKTGSGLEFRVALDKCMDLLTLSYKGVVLSQMMKNGLTPTYSGLPLKGHFPKAVNGGMLYTCGLLNVGADCTDVDGNYHPFHGQIGGTPAENICVHTHWQGDDYILEASGSMRESALFGDNLTLSRKITTRMGASTLEIHDVVENHNSSEAAFLILYHVNYGFPFLNENTRLIFPSNEIKPLSPDSEAGLPQCDQISKPLDGIKDQVFSRALTADNNGFCTIKVENKAFGIGTYLSYCQKNLPNFLYWKSMVSGDYAVGLLPTNSTTEGRTAELEKGTICRLKGFEQMEFELKIGAYDL